jgi:hypothetical protein
MIRDAEVLARTAEKEPDDDVRQKAWRHLYAKDKLNHIKSAELREMIRKFNEEAPPEPDPRETRLKNGLSHPLLAERFGRIEVRVVRETTDRRYVLDETAGGYPPPRGRVVTEKWSARVTTEHSGILSDKVFRGHRGRKGESFHPGLPVLEGNFIKFNSADIDYVDICKDVLKEMDKEDLEIMAANGSKDLRTAATELLNP